MSEPEKWCQALFFRRRCTGRQKRRSEAFFIDTSSELQSGLGKKGSAPVSDLIGWIPAPRLRGGKLGGNDGIRWIHGSQGAPCALTRRMSATSRKYAAVYTGGAIRLWELDFREWASMTGTAYPFAASANRCTAFKADIRYTSYDIRIPKQPPRFEPVQNHTYKMS